MPSFPPQELKYRLTIALSEVNKSTTVLSDPANPDTRRIEAKNVLTEKVIESDNITELKAGLADFRSNLRESN